MRAITPNGGHHDRGKAIRLPERPAPNSKASVSRGRAPDRLRPYAQRAKQDTLPGRHCPSPLRTGAASTAQRAQHTHQEQGLRDDPLMHPRSANSTGTMGAQHPHTPTRAISCLSCIAFMGDVLRVGDNRCAARHIAGVADHTHAYPTTGWMRGAAGVCGPGATLHVAQAVPRETMPLGAGL
jgi:hypothetical protein